MTPTGGWSIEDVWDVYKSEFGRGRSTAAAHADFRAEAGSHWDTSPIAALHAGERLKIARCIAALKASTQGSAQQQAWDAVGAALRNVATWGAGNDASNLADDTRDADTSAVRNQALQAAKHAAPVVAQYLSGAEPLLNMPDAGGPTAKCLMSQCVAHVVGDVAATPFQSAKQALSYISCESSSLKPDISNDPVRLLLAFCDHVIAVSRA